MKDEEEAAQLITSVRKLGPEGSGLVIANALSREEQLDPRLHDRVLKDSLGELKLRGISGKSVRPS